MDIDKEKRELLSRFLNGEVDVSMLGDCFEILNNNNPTHEDIPKLGLTMRLIDALLDPDEKSVFLSQLKSDYKLGKLDRFGTTEVGTIIETMERLWR